MRLGADGIVVGLLYCAYSGGVLTMRPSASDSVLKNSLILRVPRVI